MTEVSADISSVGSYRRSENTDGGDSAFKTLRAKQRLEVEEDFYQDAHRGDKARQVSAVGRSGTIRGSKRVKERESVQFAIPKNSNSTRSPRASVVGNNRTAEVVATPDSSSSKSPAAFNLAQAVEEKISSKQQTATPSGGVPGTEESVRVRRTGDRKSISFASPSRNLERPRGSVLASASGTAALTPNELLMLNVQRQQRSASVFSSKRESWEETKSDLEAEFGVHSFDDGKTGGRNSTVKMTRKPARSRELSIVGLSSLSSKARGLESENTATGAGQGSGKTSMRIKGAGAMAAVRKRMADQNME